MKFDANGYYIEQYIKCDNCGVLIYGQGITAAVQGEDKLFCSDWCTKWNRARAEGIEDPRIPLPKEGINTTQ